jgi:hypothetical protein
MAPSPSCFITFKNSGLSWSAVPRIVLKYPWIANRVIMSALGVSVAYAVAIRAGRHRPHPRHWESLAELAGVSADA